LPLLKLQPSYNLVCWQQNTDILLHGGGKAAVFNSD